MSRQPDWNVLTVTCPSRVSLTHIANKWTALIVIVLGRDGRLRFGDIRNSVGGISGKVLTETLRVLERDGLVERHEYAEMPPRVEYELTALGRTLHAPLQAMVSWVEQHTAEVLLAREQYAAPTRAPLEASI